MKKIFLIMFMLVLASVSTSAFDEIWSAVYNGPGDRYDCAYYVGVDGAGDVYVTGQSYGSGTRND